MHQADFLTDILIFLIAAVIIVPLLHRLRSSPILGYLAAGMIIGPYGLSLIGDTKAAHTLAEFGVVFLLFAIGLELSFDRLRALGGKVFGLGTAQVLLSGGAIGLVALWLGQPKVAAAIIGGGLALSSTAFVLQLLSEKGERASRFGLTTFSILLLQDLAVVPLLIFVTLMGDQGASFGQTIGLAALKGAAAVSVVFLFGRFLLRPLFHQIAAMRSPELFTATTLLMILGMGWVMSLAGLSMELGALLAGLLLAETEFRHQIEGDIRPFRGLLLGLFFMTIGMGIDIAFIWQNFGLILVLVSALLIGKAAIITALCRLIRLPLPEALRTGLSLAQGGEFGFVLFGAALGLGLLEAQTAQILMAVIALSMVVTPFFYEAGRMLACRLEAKDKTPAADALTRASEGLNNHVLIAGFGRVGQTVAKVVSDAGLDYLALDLDTNRVARCRERNMPVYYGDAEQLSVLEAAGIERARMAVITIDRYKSACRVVAALRQRCPDLPIFVRARDRRHMRSLLEAGATEVVSEAAESSLQLGGIVLDAVDVSRDEITRIIEEYREDDYRRLDDIISGD